MTIAVGSVIFAALMIMFSKMPLATAQIRSEGGYDNNNPRNQQGQLTGFGQRALAAHQNSIEAFPLFAAGVLLALWAQAPMETVNMLCLAFVASRVAYLVCYLLDVATLRSLVWSVGFVSSIWLMVLALP
ncbi:MAG: MAPEG family protein [Cellvibrionaceae bacterium]